MKTKLFSFIVLISLLVQGIVTASAFDKKSGLDSLTVLFEKGKGLMKCPLSGDVKLTQYKAGTLIHSVKGGEKNIHTVADGQVVMISKLPKQNSTSETLYVVVIRHGKYYSAYSNVVNVQVKKGQKVYAGNNIGVLPENKDVACYFQLRRGPQVLKLEDWLKCN